MEQKRVGYYCWAGPGLIRMTDLKYFKPKIHRDSLLKSYDLDVLERLQEKFGVSDVWATYSWGFADEQEAEDRDFLLSKLDNFKKLGMKVHAYVQGPNVVLDDFSQQDWFARDERGRLIPYYRGRKVVCVNNLGFVEYLEEKVKEVAGTDVDGVFIDNIQMGKLGVPHGEGVSEAFVGCKCEYCERMFKKEYGEAIPPRIKQKSDLGKAYLGFRKRSVDKLIGSLSKIVHKQKKEFGTNSYDPKFETKYTYGTDLDTLEKYQDYILFENHSLPDREFRYNNKYIHDLIKERETKKPVFVVSYRKGIGLDGWYTQGDINRLFSEAREFAHHVCLKGSEYKTGGWWHNFDPDRYAKPKLVPVRAESRNKFNLIKFIVRKKWLDLLIRNYAYFLVEFYLEYRLGRRLFKWAYVKILRG